MPDPLIGELEKSHSYAVPPPARGEVDWLQLALLVSERRRRIAQIFVAVLVASTVIAFLLPVKYVSSARILPPNNSQMNLSSMFLNQLAGSSGAGSMLGSALNLKNPSDVYVAMLKSRTIQDKLIDKYDLRKVYSEKTYVETRKKLQQNTDITAGKEGVIVLEIEDKDPTRARDLARAYVDNLLLLTEELSISEAAQRRVYFERELVKEKDNLAQSEVELKKMQQQTGLFLPGEQARAVVESIARLQAMVAAKQVQIGAMKNFAAAGNPELLQAQRELVELQAQLDKLQQDQAQIEGGVMIPVGKIPERTLEFIRKYRDFRYHETLFEMLAKQFELAKLEEARDYAALQILDWPVVPDRKSKPYRLLIIAVTLLATIFAILIGLLLEFEYRQRMMSPEFAERVGRLRRLWRKPDWGKA
jgi:uncharacterized protein involved in exopolysaccharide biosynthesis